jgi:GDP-L-fucose synthase
MRKVIILGSSGFLGRHLVEYLKALGVDVLGINSSNADLTDSNSLSTYVKNPKEYDTIFHLAAYTQAGTFCDLMRADQWIVNQKMNTNVLAWWKECAPHATMVAMGTSASYALENPLEEKHYLDGLPYDKFYSYAMCKRMLLVGLQCMQKQYGMNYLYLIPSTLYGANYHTDGRQQHFIFDLVRKILRGKLRNETVTLWGDGEQRRELIFVNDFIRIMLHLMGTSSNEIYNIGGGEDYSIKQFAQMICDKVDYDFNKIQFDTNQYVGATSKILHISKLRNAYESYDVSKTPLDEGIREVITWFYDNEEIFLLN